MARGSTAPSTWTSISRNPFARHFASPRTLATRELMANTVIGSTIVIDGEITGNEDLVVQGTVKGRVSLRQNVFVEETGVLEANVEASVVTILGTVTGDIQAGDRAELKSNCRVVGDIRAPRVLIADGASFKGNVDMDG